MSKSLEALNKLMFDRSLDKIPSKEEEIEMFGLIKKELKALEIIKEKQVDIKWCGDLPPLLQQTYAISQEEYELLKEIFGND